MSPSFLFSSGDVFGSKDYFYGLGVFFDTYSNHNGEHQVSELSSVVSSFWLNTLHINETEICDQNVQTYHCIYSPFKITHIVQLPFCNNMSWIVWNSIFKYNPQTFF